MSLHAFARPSGAICVLALDHRDALRNAYRRAGLPDPGDAEVLALKERVFEGLGGAASAVLLDPAALDRCRPAGAGVFMPLEAQGHDAIAGGRRTRLLDDFGPADAAALGAQGGKLLLYYRDDHDATAEAQLLLAAETAERCHRHGLALVIEPKVYRLDGEPEDAYAARFAEHVTAAAAALARSGADLLKLQFPGDADGCAAVAAAAGTVPWTLLGGAGVDGASFARHLRTAVEAGACGFIAGRPIWGGAVGREGGEQPAWLRDVARPLFDQLVEIADTYHARSVR
ncbi:MAG TPA: hypothetical protein VFG42_13740 [Baekduia sp.]|uniref:hypothetical protein n=1 Tax=Baekduia sp. TaxID=2600305 RepID=UPI002D7743FF|nr:hypothetical protein [Baekduia sp.]HET6507846.1 hypothetical protein [Baekduia sp.]